MSSPHESSSLSGEDVDDIIEDSFDEATAAAAAATSMYQTKFRNPRRILDDSLLTPRKVNPIISSDESGSDSDSDEIGIPGDLATRSTPRVPERPPSLIVDDTVIISSDEDEAKEVRHEATTAVPEGGSSRTSGGASSPVKQPSPPPRLPLALPQQQPPPVPPQETLRNSYKEQEAKVMALQTALQQTKQTLKAVNVAALPDKGRLLLKRDSELTIRLEQERATLRAMAVPAQKPAAPPADPFAQFRSWGGGKLMGPFPARNDPMKPLDGAVAGSEGPKVAGPAKGMVQLAWEDIEAGVGAVQPKHQGKVGMAHFNRDKAMTMDRLNQLHGALKTCPTEADLAPNPRGLKSSVDLMAHQKRALAWLAWRERQKPSGGILADDMGLGKTLTMISLLLQEKDRADEEGRHDDDDDEEEEDDEKENWRKKRQGGTLVICPATLINQWDEEVKTRTKRGTLSVVVYHGPKRESNARSIAKNDIVITTYQTAKNECEKDGAIARIRWRRVILDEAHQIRNPKTQASQAMCRLSAKSRWALTGTPIHNRDQDMYGLLKFLRCTPFDDIKVWKMWVGDKSPGGLQRLHTVIKSLMLRRTKKELMELGNSLFDLPPKKWELVEVTMDKEELHVYQKVLLFSRTLFSQFLHQRAERNQDVVNMHGNAAGGPNEEYFKMRKKLLGLRKVKEINQHEILVLILRLRQICCHPSLITKMLQGDEDLGGADDPEDAEEWNLLEQLNRLDLNDDDKAPEGGVADGISTQGETVSVREAAKGYLNPSNPVFEYSRESSKFRKVLEVLRSEVGEDDKAIIVSQWSSLLERLALHLKAHGIRYDTLDGSVPVPNRTPIVNSFNDPTNPTKVLLLSLTAGGVGLNLVGANHLFLLDLHWNPQLENQAQDRIYRMGQKKPVSLYKFMAVDSIEKRIKELQDNKLELAESMMSGAKVVSNKLTINDLKALFEL